MAWHFSNEESAETAYEDLKEKLRDGTANKASAIGLLHQIITDLPGTWIAGLANQLLDDIDTYY